MPKLHCNLRVTYFHCTSQFLSFFSSIFQMVLKVLRRAFLWKTVPCLLDQIWMENHPEETADVRWWPQSFARVLQCFFVMLRDLLYEPVWFLPWRGVVDLKPPKHSQAGNVYYLLHVEKASVAWLDSLRYKYSYSTMQKLITGSLFISWLIAGKSQGIKEQNQLIW